MSELESLLRPTLGGAGAAPIRIHSPTVGYLASFFGGPVAGAIVALVNAWRLRRFRRDAWLLPVAVLIEGLYASWLHAGGLALMQEADLPGNLPFRLLGLLFFAAIYALHRRYYRGMEVLGITAVGGWVVGVAAIVAGIALWLMVGEAAAVALETGMDPK